MAAKTPISTLQEVMAGRKLALPVYVEEGCGGSFKCTVFAAGITAEGFSSNKKGAKHESAKNALQKLGVPTKIPDIKMFEQKLVRTEFHFEQKPVGTEFHFKNYVGNLNEFSSKRGLLYPEYIDNHHVTIDGEFYIRCSFAGKETLGRGMNKKDAKQNAAKQMLDLVTAMDPIIIASQMLPNKKEIKIELSNHESIISMYETLTVKDNRTNVMKKTDELKAIPEIKIVANESVDSLKEKLRKHGIEYSLQMLQSSPCIIFLGIKGTDLRFAGTGDTKEEATRQVLQEVLEAAQNGVSLTTNDLISF